MARVLFNDSEKQNFLWFLYPVAPSLRQRKINKSISDSFSLHFHVASIAFLKVSGFYFISKSFLVRLKTDVNSKSFHIYIRSDLNSNNKMTTILSRIIKTWTVVGILFVKEQRNNEKELCSGFYEIEYFLWRAFDSSTGLQFQMEIHE